MSPQLLTYESAAKVLGISPNALKQLVYRNQGPAIVRLGRNVRFCETDIVDYIEARRIPNWEPHNG